MLLMRNKKSGRRERRKKVVHVQDLRPENPNALRYRVGRAERVKSMSRSLCPPLDAMNRVIVETQSADLMTMPLQHGNLFGDDGILASRLLIAIMQHKHAHSFPS
jgi:hypothetical protein